MNSEIKTTGERIRKLRLRRHLTLDDVAKYLGVGKQAIYKYEQGTVTNIPLDNLEKMAVLFGTTPGYLAGWSDDESSGYESAQVDPEISIVSGMMENLPQETKEQIVAIVRALVLQQNKKG